MPKNCEFCGGSGQISFFQGVSRFLLTVEECPECAGTGLELEPGSGRKSKEIFSEELRPKKKRKQTNKR